MLLPEAVAANKTRWALVYPNYEYGQSAAAAFKELLKARQRNVEFVSEQASSLGKIDAGAVAQAIDDAKPDGIFSALFGGDLAKLVREGTTRGTFKDRVVVNLLGGEPEYLDPLKDEAPVGWIVTGYPWNEITTPEHKAFLAAYQKRYNDYPGLGSIVGYLTMKSLAPCRWQRNRNRPDTIHPLPATNAPARGRTIRASVNSPGRDSTSI
jgi:branched-chain amino acid transport system substrate-binding protein